MPKQQSILKSFVTAARGFFLAIRSERNLRIALAAAACAIALGFALSVSLLEWCLILYCIGLVLASELLNTALETVIDMVSPRYDYMAGKAKDIAAGSSFIVSVISAIIGLIIFVPRIIELFD